MGSQTWTYDSTWKDKLIGYNGATITYDEIGNPLTDGTWTYTWAQGRKLQQITKTGTTISYKYNDSGIRTEKTVNGVTMVYNVVGGKVTWEKTGSNNPIYYTYDASGSLWGMQYNGSMYFYVRNAQGDIIKLINSSGAVVVEYAYDAWGRLMSTTGSLAGTLGVDNPYRYRGYRFDTETGLYYLQSRYYNPHWGRFLNADGLIGKIGNLAIHNIFIYSANQPTHKVDPSGFRSIIIDENSVNMTRYKSNSFNYYNNKNNRNNWTYGAGICISGAFIFSGSILLGPVCDSKGNIGCQISIQGGGGLAASVSVTRYRALSNANNIFQLEDLGFTTGGSVGHILGGGAEYFTNVGPEIANQYNGILINYGLVEGVEMHGEISNSWILFDFNIIDLFESVFGE